MMSRSWSRRGWGTAASEIAGIALRSGGRVGDGFTLSPPAFPRSSALARGGSPRCGSSPFEWELAGAARVAEASVEMLATHSGVSRAASSAVSCRFAVQRLVLLVGTWRCGSPCQACLIGSCLAGSGSTSLVFLEDDGGLTTVASIGDFGWGSPGAHGPGLMRAGPAGEEQRMVFQGAVISNEHTSQFFPPGTVLATPSGFSRAVSTACVPFQDTDLAALITPKLHWDSLWVVGPRWASLQNPSVWSVAGLLSVLESRYAEASAPRAWPFRQVSQASSRYREFLRPPLARAPLAQFCEG